MVPSKLTLEFKSMLDCESELKLPDLFECKNDGTDARSAAAEELPMEGGIDKFRSKS